MRYLFVTSYPPTRCGIGVYALQSVERLRNEGHIIDIISPDMDGNVDFKYNLCGGFKIMKLLKLGIFYDKIVIQYHPSFFFKDSGDFGDRWDNLATNLAFAFFFLCYRKKIEVVCHEIYYYSIQRIGILNYLARGLWWLLVITIVFHTQKEWDIFKRNFRFGIRWKQL